MELRCDYSHPAWHPGSTKGACNKLLVVYHDGAPFVRCGKCGQETEIPMEGKTVANLDRLSVTA